MCRQFQEGMRRYVMQFGNGRATTGHVYFSKYSNNSKMNLQDARDELIDVFGYEKSLTLTIISTKLD